MDLANVFEEFRTELPVFREMTGKFYAKEMTAKEYKGISGRYGSYAQRGGKENMLRLRLSGGRIDKEKLKFIADCITEYRIERIHFTTCQTIQFHDLAGTAVYEIMERALDHGILTWGCGGDFPRNVMVSPLSGVEKGEYFDVMPYAQAVADYLMMRLPGIKLPRKLKVGFSNHPSNITHATFRDLGFAAGADGRFDVYSAGGLGPNPKMGLCVARGVEPAKVLYYVKTMIEVFAEYGNYENRSRARTRYMQDELGQEGYVKVFLEKLKQMLESEEDLEILHEGMGLRKRGDGSVAEGNRVAAQKQDGLYAVVYHPIAGTPDPAIMGILYETIEPMEDVEMRLSPDEGMYIINCTGEEAEKIIEVTRDSARNLFETSVACIGAATCQVGIRDSQKVLRSLIEEFREKGFGDGVLPKIHISGCPSSCGTHQIGAIGFCGGVKVIDKTPYPAFALYINGCSEEGEERFGEKAGVILEKDIPAFLRDVGNEVGASGMVFEEWFLQKEDKLREIAGVYLQ